jgi:hypothetical protein
MSRLTPKFFGLFFLLAGCVSAQTAWSTGAQPAGAGAAPFLSLATADASLPNALSVLPTQAPIALVAPAPLPRMAPEFALQVYRNRVAQQAAQLSAYSAATSILAQLPDTQQYGQCDLQRHYAAPRTLEFKSVHFVGDNFVKSNVILRLLQSEVDHLQKDDPALSAIDPANYKFSYKGTSQLGSREVHVFQLKPHKKRTGLFKGRIYLDAYTGSMVRAEGRLAKSPSLFIKKIEFVQDYADIGSFTFPVHIHSEAQTRLIGRAVVDVIHRDYQPVSTVQVARLTTGH